MDMTDTLTKGSIFKNDLSLWDGINSTGSRKTSTGGVQNLNRFDWIGVDIYQIYSNRDHSSINSTLKSIGTTQKAKIFLSPGIWSLDESVDFTSYGNIMIEIAPGAIFSRVTGNETITFHNPQNLICGKQQQITSIDMISFANAGSVSPHWWGIDGTNDEIEIGYAFGSLPSNGIVEFTPYAYTIDTSLDLSSYTTILLDIKSNATFSRITGDEILTIYSPDNLLIGDQQAITSVDMIDFTNGGIVHPEWWGNGNDTLTYAVNSIKGTIGVPSGSIVKGGTILLSDNTYTLSTALQIGSGIDIRGIGSSSKISEAGSFTGSDLIQLIAYSSSTYAHAVIENLELVTTTAVAIQAIASVVGNATFRNIFLNAVNGLMLNTYTQDCLIESIYSGGAIDQILHLKGNFNIVDNIDKEGSTGTSADPYIYIEEHSTGNSDGVILRNILIEGTTSANKSIIKLYKCSNLMLENLWFEPTSTDGYVIRIDTCTGGNIKLKGNLQFFDSVKAKLKINDSWYVSIDEVTIEGYDEPFADSFEVDSTSRLIIDKVVSRRGSDLKLLSNANIIVRNHYSRQITTDGLAGYDPFMKINEIAPQNLLSNPSFEAGRYNWTYSTVPGTTEEYIASTIGAGLMAHAQWAAGGSYILSQTITVPAAWVGLNMTYSIWIKLSGSDGWATPLLDGAGIAAATGYQRLYAGNGWGQVFQTVNIQQAGNLSVGIYFVNVLSTTEVWFDEAWLSFGNESITNPARYGSIELGQGGTNHGGNTITYDSAAPATGTWKQGDIVFNTGAAASGTVGWVCTTAGSPGTWKTFGTIAA